MVDLTAKKNEISLKGEILCHGQVHNMLTPKSYSNDFPDFNWDDFEVPAVSFQVGTN